MIPSPAPTSATTMRPHIAHGWLTPIEFIEVWLHQQQGVLAQWVDQLWGTDQLLYADKPKWALLGRSHPAEIRRTGKGGLRGAPGTTHPVPPRRRRSSPSGRGPSAEPGRYPRIMQVRMRTWPARRSPGIVGGVLFLAGVLATLTVMALLAILGLALLALAAVALGAQYLLAALSPAYRRRRSERTVSMPTVLRSMVRFAPGRDQVIEATATELPGERHRG